MKKVLAKRTLSVEVPPDLYNMLSRLCIDTGLSKTEVIIQYLNYLHKQGRHKKIINEDSKQDFKLDAREPQ